jgi:hypothetical protein
MAIESESRVWAHVEFQFDAAGTITLQADQGIDQAEECLCLCNGEADTKADLGGTAVITKDSDTQYTILCQTAEVVPAGVDLPVALTVLRIG